MNKLVLDINDDVISALEKIKQIDGASIEIEIPEGSIVLDNITNLKLLERKATDYNKSLHFHTTDPVGKTLVSILNNEEEETSGFITKRVALEDEVVMDAFDSGGRRLPSIRNPLSGMSMPPLGKLKLLIPFILFLALMGGAFAYFSNSGPTANVTIVVNSQPLTKSFPIKVGADLSTSEGEKTLKGMTKIATVEEKTSIETTGETIEGEKAKGKVKIYNKTSDDIKLKKGTELKYDDEPKDLVYKTTEEVTVPAKTDLPSDPADPTIIRSKAGEKTVGIEAFDFGSAYNLDQDEELRVDDYDDDELYAVVDDEVKGGSSKKVKVVSKEDVAKIKQEMTPKILEKSEKALKEQESNNYVFVTGSVDTSIASEQYSHKEGEKTDTLELIQAGQSTGLFYSKTELNVLVDKLVDKFVPDGYKLSSDQRDVKVEILGESDSSVLSPEEADLQITLRTYVVPALDEETLKNELAGKSLKEAEKVLGSIRNIKTYGINLDGAISLPMFQKVPKNTENIQLEIQLND